MNAACQIRAIERRFNAIALEQLRAEAARLASENDELRTQLALAEDDAESWRRDATEMHLQLCEALGGAPGITVDGTLVVTNGGGVH